MLRPVRSGLFRAFEPPAPPVAAEPEPSITEPRAEEQPWLDTPALEEYEASELLLEVSVDDEGEELQILAAASGGELVAEPEPDQDPVAGMTLLGDLDKEPLHSAPAPLSAWDLGSGRDVLAEEELRLARVREEWEALGQALVESLAMPEEREPVRSGWTGYPPADETEAETAATLEVEGLEPIGAGLERETPGTQETEPPPMHGRALQELAQRLETFAAALRTEGRYAVTRAQLSGDRMESMLAGFAAGWLAARGE
jgi:hypothetical protein